MTDFQHGTTDGYSNHGCRCADCRAANTRAMADYRQRNPAAGQPCQTPGCRRHPSVVTDNGYCQRCNDERGEQRAEPEEDRWLGGMILRSALRDTNMSQPDLARALGITSPTVNQIIRGKMKLSPSRALDLERILGVDAATLLHVQADAQLERARTQP